VLAQPPAPSDLARFSASASLTLPSVIGLDADDLDGILDQMFEFRPHLPEPPALVGIKNNPIAGQPFLQQFDLEFGKPYMRIAARRPRLHPDRHKSSICRSPTFWATSTRVQGRTSRGSLSGRTS